MPVEFYISKQEEGRFRFAGSRSRRSGPGSLWSTLAQGEDFLQPLAAYRHAHIEILFINIAGTFYYLCNVLDG
jgi:hypothetical protein